MSAPASRDVDARVAVRDRRPSLEPGPKPFRCICEAQGNFISERHPFDFLLGWFFSVEPSLASAEFAM